MGPRPDGRGVAGFVREFLFIFSPWELEFVHNWPGVRSLTRQGNDDVLRRGSFSHVSHLSPASRRTPFTGAAILLMDRILIAGLLIAGTSTAGTGCRSGFETLDVFTVRSARAAFQQHYEQYPLKRKEEAIPPAEQPAGGSTGSIILGELIAIFPGLIVQGLGHSYAGDHKTARHLRHIGEFGYVMTAVGGGLVIGGYYLDKSTDWAQGYVYALYGTGGTIGVVGVGYILIAWIYDMIDTPRAVETGGRPPPRSEFIESLDLFD